MLVVLAKCAPFKCRGSNDMPITSNNTNVFAETVSGGGGSGTPASSVVSQTSYSLSSAVGTSTDYARADHRHGTPAPVPGPGSARCMFGTVSIYDSSGLIGGTIFGEIIPSSPTFDTTYAIINQKLFANGNGWTSLWYTLASIVQYAEYVICVYGDTTNTMVYAGFDSTGGGNIGSQGIATDQAFFYFDSNNVAGMTNFFLVTTDSAGGVTSIDTGVTVLADTEYKLKIQFTTPTTVVASINNVVVATSTTHTPGVSVTMNHGVWSNTGNIRFNRMYAQEGI